MRRLFVAAIVVLSGTNLWAFGQGGEGVEQALAAMEQNGQVQLTQWKSVPETVQKIRSYNVNVEKRVTFDELVDGNKVTKE